MKSSDLTTGEVSTYYHARVPRLKQTGPEWRGPCPVHDGADDNFSVEPETGLAYCHSQCGRGWSILQLETELSGTSWKECRREIDTLVGRPTNGHNGRPKWREVATYDYTDAKGEFLFQVVRFEPKTFRQRRRVVKIDGTSAGITWVYNIKGISRVLYRLPKVLAADQVILVEGEKDVENLEKLGFAATCNPGGACSNHGKWLKNYTESLEGRRVVILPDNDPPGARHAEIVKQEIRWRVKELKIVTIPVGKDASDWIAGGATREQIQEVIDATPVEPKEMLPPVALAGQTSEQNPAERGGSAATDVPNLLLQLLNDTGNADRLIAVHGEGLRYCPSLRKWMVWDGRRWAVDTLGAAKRLAKRTMLRFLEQAVNNGDDDQKRFAYSSLDARRIANLLAMAECEIVITPDELDTHPFLLNFLNGTLNLETGELTPHSREHFITKLVHYNYNPKAECPTFLSFIVRIMGNHPDASETDLDRAERMVEYLQRGLGYSLTGTTEEKAVFVPFGTGNNGKTTLLSTFLLLLDEYSELLQVDTLMVRQESNNTQADLADLRGARFVMTSETEEGQRLAQGKLKRITQGMGRIKATRKYENPIEFPETHKLWMDTNSKPIIRAAEDDATFNRLHPIPFTVTIPKKEIDKTLPRKLLAEAEGILAWAVEGVMRWRRVGLDKPPEVNAANKDWQVENDQLGRFIEDCCLVADSFSGRARQLYESYREWTESAGEKAITETMFGKRLKDRGFPKVRQRHGMVYQGITVRLNENDVR